METKLFDQTIVGDAEQALEFIGNILESSTEYSIIGKDLDGNILLWNEGARRLYGYEPEEVVGRANSSILHTPEDVAASKPREIIESALLHGKWEGTLTRVRKNGQRFTARVVITPRRDAAGRAVGLLLISKDISNEIRLTEELQATQFYTRSLIESNIDALMTTDPAGIITDVNQQMAMVGDRDKVLASGFDGYLPKPIVPETFVRQVEAFLRPEQRSNQLPIISAATGDPAKHPAKRATILVVDDSPVNLNLIRSTLEPFGYQVIQAPGPKEAMELARQTRPDLILSDLHMPDQSGLEFPQRIKADPQLRSLPFLLFFTSPSAHAELERASALGAERFLCRPIKPQALLAEVGACLERSEGK